MGVPPANGGKGAVATRADGASRDAKVVVAVRVRPGNAREKAHSRQEAVMVLDRKVRSPPVRPLCSRLGTPPPYNSHLCTHPYTLQAPYTAGSSSLLVSASYSM